MLFLVYFEVNPENRDKSVARLKAMGDGAPDSVKPMGTWFSVTLLQGWAVIEAEDASALGEYMKHWTDLNVNRITPVLAEDDFLKLIS